MKTYFDFKQTGTKLFLVCLVYLICMVVYGYYSINESLNRVAMVQNPDMAQSLADSFLWLGMVVAYALVCLLLDFFIIRMLVEGVAYKGETVRTNYDFAKFLWLVISSLFLTIITIGIYTPWYYTRLVRFFSSGATYDGKPFEFKGIGSLLFCILTFSLIIPTIVLTILLIVSSQVAMAGGSFFTVWFPLCAILFVMIMALTYYLIYKWFIDFKWGNKQIKLQVETGPSVAFMFIQVLLSILTAGLYYPAAMVLVYRYYVSHTEVLSESGEATGRLGYDGEIGMDYFYLLGQLVLGLITVGIYSPWMVVRILRRLARRTYLEQADTEPVSLTIAD